MFVTELKTSFGKQTGMFSLSGDYIARVVFTKKLKTQQLMIYNTARAFRYEKAIKKTEFKQVLCEWTQLRASTKDYQI